MEENDETVLAEWVGRNGWKYQIYSQKQGKWRQQRYRRCLVGEPWQLEARIPDEVVIEALEDRVVKLERLLRGDGEEP